MPILAAPRLRIFWLFPLACVAVMGVGCVEQTLSIDTNPPGALVFLNDKQFGRAPVKKDFLWYGKYDVAVRMEGYDTLQTATWIKAPWWNWVPLDFFATVLPFQFRDSQHLSYTLMPTTSQTVDPLTLIARANELKGQLESSPFTRAPTSTQPAATQNSTRPATGTQPSR